YHSNPIYGRGAPSGLVQAALLDEALERHPRDLAAAARHLDRRSEAELRPFWEAAVAGDRRALGERRAFALTSPRAWLVGVAERAQLGVPLHADQEGVALGLDRLDDAVGAPRDRAQPLPQTADRLMVHGVHAQLGRAEDAREPARWLDAHRVLDRAELGMAVPDLLAEVIRDVGDEVAAERDVHELHAAADAEDGKFPARERGARERQLEAVALGRDAVVGLVANAAVVRRIDVAAAREDEGRDGAEGF